MIEWWNWLNANAAGVSAMAAVSTAFIAVLTMWASASDSRRRTRPYVLVDLRPDPHTKAGVMNLVVENIGQSAARELKVTFDPALPIPEDKTGSFAWYVIRRYEAPVSLLGPGQSLVNVWRVREARGDKDGPRQVVVRVAYRDDEGRRTYSDSFNLDATTVEFAAGVMVPSERSSLSKIADHLSKG